MGGQEYRTRTAVDAGKNPVWNETFNFNCINENTAEIVILDEDLASRDDTIGTAIVSLARAREHGTDRQQVCKGVGGCGEAVAENGMRDAGNGMRDPPYTDKVTAVVNRSSRVYGMQCRCMC